MGQIDLTWNDFSNGVTYNVYRTTSPVSNVSDLPTPLVTGLLEKTYTDTTVVGGNTYFSTLHIPLTLFLLWGILHNTRS